MWSAILVADIVESPVTIDQPAHYMPSADWPASWPIGAVTTCFRAWLIFYIGLATLESIDVYHIVGLRACDVPEWHTTVRLLCTGNVAFVWQYVLTRRDTKYLVHYFLRTKRRFFCARPTSYKVGSTSSRPKRAGNVLLLFSFALTINKMKTKKHNHIAMKSRMQRAKCFW